MISPMRKYFALILLFNAIFLPSCFNSKPKDVKTAQIARKQDDIRYRLAPLERQLQKSYPWEEEGVKGLPKITKDFFRCNGSLLNPEKWMEKGEQKERLADCGGSASHSLPLRNEQEFIYPILPTLLNYLQAQTGKRVVITSGHRCPQHNTYVDFSKENQFSKHMIGAETSFYVQGLMDQPEKIVQLLIDYYKESPEQEYTTFQRYEKEDTNVSTKPWFNKEIYIKLFKPCEGRNFDNRHPYPYISIQVRYDKEQNEKVVYTWDQACKNYLRR